MLAATRVGDKAFAPRRTPDRLAGRWQRIGNPSHPEGPGEGSGGEMLGQRSAAGWRHLAATSAPAARAPARGHHRGRAATAPHPGDRSSPAPGDHDREGLQHQIADPAALQVPMRPEARPDLLCNS